MKSIFSQLLFLLAVASIAIVSCVRDNPGQPPELSSEKLITYFGFKAGANPGLTADVNGSIGPDTIKLDLPGFGNLSNLVPAILFKGKSINPAGDIGHNFNSPVIYTVMAEDGTKKNYTVVVKNLADSAKEIISFIFKKASNPGLQADVVGDISTDSISLRVPFGMSLSNLVPDITATGLTITPANLTAQNFSQPVQYMVTARDGTIRNYKVWVTLAPMPATIFVNSVSFEADVLDPNSGKLYALDANTGKLQWKYDPPNGYFCASPAFDKGVIYTSNRDKIVAIDTATKAAKWQYTAGDLIQSSILVANGIVYSNCNDGYLHAVDQATGNLKWKFAQEIAVTHFGNVSSPTIVNGVVYFGSYKDQYVYAVDAVTGILKWKTFNTYGNGSGFFASSPAVSNETLYIGDCARNLIALNASDGAIKWVFEAGGLFHASPTIDNGVVYIGSTDGYLYAVNAADGTLKWKHFNFLQIQSSPIVSQGTVFFASAGGAGSKVVYAIDAEDGTQKWVYTYRTDFAASPVVINGMVCISTYTDFLALDANTGNLKWKFISISPREDMRASPCVVNQQGQIFYSAISGHKD